MTVCKQDWLTGVGAENVATAVDLESAFISVRDCIALVIHCSQAVYLLLLSMEAESWEFLNNGS